METENLIKKITDEENKKNTYYLLTDKGNH